MPLRGARGWVITDGVRYAMRSVEVTRRWEVQPLQGFRDPGKVQPCSSLYPNVPAGSAEGKRIRKEMVDKERDPKLARAVKEINRARNGGVPRCPNLFHKHTQFGWRR
ncbi:hypothetical protein GCM10010869_21900 [Mesorhizobium tianshanense]|nr:hypothetical protein GCM10010869_21900 [Mesorhizobium tianshanense]